MPATAPNDVRNSRFFVEPQRTLLTPSASPSVGPPDRPLTKRARLRSTPSSSISTTPSASNESTSSADVNSARRASTLRVLNTWGQLAERYNKRLDEDDIIDLHRFVIIKDRGAVDGAPREYDFGHFTQLDGEQDYPDADQEDSEQDEDENEFNALPPSETTTDDDAPISKKELLRGVPPLSATTDAEDLREFLEAERKRRELAGDEEDEEDMTSEQRSALRKELQERLQKREAAITNETRDVASAEPAVEPEVDATPTRPSARIPPSDDESEDELALWTHDESTAVYPLARGESEQDVREVEREVIELTESDSDEEFGAILTHPPRFTRVSPASIPPPKEVQQPLQSPPDSERGNSGPRRRSHSKTKLAEATPKSEDRPRSPLVPRKPEVTLAHKRKPYVAKEAGTMSSDDGRSDRVVVGSISPTRKGKCKEIPHPVEDGHCERTPKSFRVASRGRKRKRIASSSVTGSPPSSSPVEAKSILRSHGKSSSQNSAVLPQPDGPKPTSDKEVSTPVRFDPAVAGPSHSLSTFSATSKTRSHSSPVTSYRSLEPGSVPLTSHDRSPTGPLHSGLPILVTHPYSQRHPSHPPSIFSPPNHGTPGLSSSAHPPPPMDPVQTQQAHYLLAQAMHQLSYFLSATMPYTGYASSPGQSWPPPPPPPPHTAYSTPIHHPPHFHNTHRYHTPSSSISRAALPPSSPVESSVSPPVEEQRSRSRARSKSRGRRVSFKLGSEEVAGQVLDAQPEFHRIGQKSRRQTLEAKREKGEGKGAEELDRPLRLEEDRGGPPRDVTRGRTPGPPSRKKIDVPRGRSLSRR